MNLFRDRDQDAGPQFSISLDEDYPDPFYPGARVSGRIELENHERLRLRHSQVSFVGHVVTHSTHSDDNSGAPYQIEYHDDARLFRLHHDLDDDITVEPGLLYTWPFAFTFPDMTVIDRPGIYTGPSAYSGRYTDKNHRLPPSLGIMTNQGQYCAVYYGIRATSLLHERPNHECVGDLRLNFKPLGASPRGTFTDAVKARQKYSTSRLVGQPKSLTQSVYDMISSQTPHIWFTIKARVEDQLVISTPFKIYACVEIDTLSDPAISIDVIEMSVKSLKLYPCTAHRAKEMNEPTSGAAPDRAARGFENEVSDEESILLNARPDRRVVQQQHNIMDGREEPFYRTDFDARIPANIPPTFHTFTINRSYGLKVTIEVEICGKTFEHTAWVDVLILSNQVGGAPPGYA